MGSSQWKFCKPNMPLTYCRPYGRLADINGIMHVGVWDKMYQLKEGVWKGKDHNLGVDIWSVLECEGKGYVIDRDGWYSCKNIYEWKSEESNLELLAKIGDQYQLNYRSAIGYNRKIYLVGGEKSDGRVDCFDINTREWKPVKKMKNERFECSLAVIDDKMFVGGGYGAGNSVECFLIKEEKWIDIKSTTKEECQLSSWNRKLVATGGENGSNCVELYDEWSGEWLPLPSMNQGRVLHGACETKDNQLVVVGGWNAKNSVEYLKL